MFIIEKKEKSKSEEVKESININDLKQEERDEFKENNKKSKGSLFYKIISVCFMLLAFFGGLGYFLYVQLGMQTWAVTLLMLFCVQSLIIMGFTTISIFSYKDIIMNFKLLLKKHKGFGIYYIVRGNKILDRVCAKLELNPKIEKNNRLINKKNIYYIKQSPLHAIPCVFVGEEEAKSITLENTKDMGAPRFSEIMKLGVAYGMSKMLSKDKTIIMLLAIGFLITLILGAGNLLLSLKTAGIIQ